MPPDWKGSFDGLLLVQGRYEIAYTITEDALEGYEAKVKGDMRWLHRDEHLCEAARQDWFVRQWAPPFGLTILGGRVPDAPAVRRKA